MPNLPLRLGEVFREHGPFVCRSLRYLGVKEPDLDDMLQEVFVVVCRRLGDYEEKGRTRAWLYSICTRVVRSHRRKLGRRREAALVTEEPVAPVQLNQVEDAEALALGRELLERLPKAQREVFMLYEVEDMPMSEIAQALGCPLQTAYSRLYKARRRILAAVASLGAENKR
ncbi:MAG: sigma-70 family RNA polymerase sigma factor [Myxococcales bacterium]|nr:sigma-70 family RNA polymerase sigma factor [Myxococcales bacterium]MDD9967189.1 sigma-70 family RNA polymerase sigma factor [Myxococcales bacterium]